MSSLDPFSNPPNTAVTAGGGSSGRGDGGDADAASQQIGSHLTPLTRLEALTRVEGVYRSNNGPVDTFDRGDIGRCYLSIYM